LEAGANSLLKQSLEAPMPALLVTHLFHFGAILAYAIAGRASWPAVGSMRVWHGGRGWAVWQGWHTASPPSCWRAARERRR
jgi:hypothetical protein